MEMKLCQLCNEEKEVHRIGKNKEITFRLINTLELTEYEGK